MTYKPPPKLITSESRGVRANQSVARLDSNYIEADVFDRGESDCFTLCTSKERKDLPPPRETEHSIGVSQKRTPLLLAFGSSLSIAV